MLIDSHCHLYMLSDPAGAVRRAKAAGVGIILSPSSSRGSWDEIERFDMPGVYHAVGLHPAEAAEPAGEDELRARLSKGVIAIGETGLDYHYGDDPPKKAQEKNFRAHIRLARETGLPLLLHNRDSNDDMLKILDDELGRGKFRAVVHSFTGDARLRDFALEAGFLISASGIITFKSAGEICDSFSLVPPGRAIIETDAPFLAPVPHRGRENEPAFVTHVAAKLAGIYGMSQEDIEDVTTRNFKDYFSLA
ncbi:MAG: TatD family hydrolase [Rickettsiales bacterium]|jgi:TatD DNase family protein|nr:TatD family hydrolase [Rickettsiales bacterium]